MSDTSSLASSDTFTSAREFKCEECNSTFSKRYNLERHIETIHDASDKEEYESECEDETMSTDEDSNKDRSDDETESGEDTSEDESSSDDEEMENEERVTFMFRTIACQAYDEHKEELDPIAKEYMEKGMTEKEAVKQALLKSNEARKTLRNLYVTNLIDISEHVQDPLYKAIVAKAQELIDDGFTVREAFEAAVSYRKHGIYNLMNYL